MTVAIAEFLHVYTSTGTTIYKWQSFWPGQTVDAHTFYGFQLDPMLSGRSGQQPELLVRLPLNATTLTLLEDGISNRYLATASPYQFTPPAGGGLPATKTLIASFTGEVNDGQLDQINLSMVIASSLISTEAQVPHRRYTTTLVGTPPKL